MQKLTLFLRKGEKKYQENCIPNHREYKIPLGHFIIMLLLQGTCKYILEIKPTMQPRGTVGLP